MCEPRHNKPWVRLSKAPRPRICTRTGERAIKPQSFYRFVGLFGIFFALFIVFSPDIQLDLSAPYAYSTDDNPLQVREPVQVFEVSADL